MRKTTRVLFVHQAFPGQYLHIAPALACRPGYEVVALTMGEAGVRGVRNIRHHVARGSTPGIHPLAGDFEAKVIRGESAARAALVLRDEGFIPDLICGHPGWGETLFLKDVWPTARLLNFVEFAYRSNGADVGFDPEFPLNEAERFRVRSKNAAVYLSITDADWLVSPTAWQAQQIPDVFRNRVSVIHDGIDSDRVRPSADATLRVGRDQIMLKPGDELVTFVNRNLEPYRGYHVFMRALPGILRQRPNAHVIIVGGDGVSYGAPPASGHTYRQKYLDEVKDEIDASRVHFVGNVSYKLFITILQVSAAHVYLTYPFVLSWSMLEAMSAGCVVIGSATAPVEEVINQGQNGLLVDFFSPSDITSAVVGVLKEPNAFMNIRKVARQTILSKYDMKRVCLPKHIDLIQKLVHR